MSRKDKNAITAINSSFDLLRSKAIEGLKTHFEEAERLVLIYRYVLLPLSNIASRSMTKCYRVNWQAIADRYVYAILLGLAGLTLESSSTLRFIMDITYNKLWVCLPYDRKCLIKKEIDYERYNPNGAYNQLSSIIHEGRTIDFKQLAKLAVKIGDFSSSILLLNNMSNFSRLLDRKKVIKYSEIIRLELMQRILNILSK